ncbi:MAG: helix-turn-helix transcriptional regulator [Streptomycetaceae bacterium]|nr:helix-turn-helix transcriptional regulator [Streptomycetaceae bacterium]
MPARHVDGRRIRRVRRAAELSQLDVGRAVGVSDAAVANWENGKKQPDAEKLPALAKVLGKQLDELFPRHGLPDLADLRADAGLYQKETGAIIGTRSHAPVSNAERGVRRLDPKYVQPLAQAYGVSAEKLLAAQERSFGRQVPERRSKVPTTLAEKITYLLEHSYPGDDQAPPSDTKIADAVNAHAGAQVISQEGIRHLRTGVVETASPVVLEGLAAFFAVSPMYFQPDDAVARQVYEGLRLLSAARKGKVSRITGRGMGPEGLPISVLEFVNDLITELEEKEPEANA